jgi:CRP-like cAMP-binding protein
MGSPAMNVDDEAAVLSRVPTFAKCDPARLKLLAFTSRALRFVPGEVIFHAGEPSDCALLILEGTVEFVGETAGGEFIINTAGAHQMIGEMGVIMDVPRTLMVRARDDVRVLRISAQVFLKLLSENPEVALDMMRTLSERLQATTQRLTKTQAALIDAGAAARRTP